MATSKSDKSTKSAKTVTSKTSTKTATKSSKAKTTAAKTKSKVDNKANPKAASRPKAAPQPNDQSNATVNDEHVKNGHSLDERNWGMYCHLAAFLGYVIPFGNIIGPLVIWLSKGEQYEFVADQGKESLNFQITMTIYFLVTFALIFVLIGIPILIGLIIFEFVVIILAGLKARDGINYRYPITIRFIS